MAELDEVARIISEAEQATSAGDHEAAEQGLRRALKLQEADLGLVHPDVANTLNDLGVVCDMLGRPNEAEFLYRRALGIARRTLGADHPYIATSLQNLSNLYRAQGKPEKLAEVADGRPQRSGLPGVDSSDEAGWEADAPGEMLGPETLVVPAPVIGAQPGAHAQSWFSPLYERLAHPPVLLAGMGVVLLSILWLLFGGSAGPDAPEEGASAAPPLQARAGETDTVGPDPAGGARVRRVRASAERGPFHRRGRLWKNRSHSDGIRGPGGSDDGAVLGQTPDLRCSRGWLRNARAGDQAARLARCPRRREVGGRRRCAGLQRAGHPWCRRRPAGRMAMPPSR